MSSCLTMSGDTPPPLPARTNLPPLNRGGTAIGRTKSAIGRPLPPTPPREPIPAASPKTPNKSVSSSNYENHELSVNMVKSKTVPADIQNLGQSNTPKLPPRRPTLQHSKSEPKTGDVSPAPPTTMNELFRENLEDRFPFHSETDFPDPEPFIGETKVYASEKGVRKKPGGTMRKKSSESPAV